jgi:hypothetical protein
MSRHTQGPQTDPCQSWCVRREREGTEENRALVTRMCRHYLEINNTAPQPPKERRHETATHSTKPPQPRQTSGLA